MSLVFEIQGRRKREKFVFFTLNFGLKENNGNGKLGVKRKRDQKIGKNVNRAENEEEIQGAALVLYEDWVWKMHTVVLVHAHTLESLDSSAVFYFLCSTKPYYYIIFDKIFIWSYMFSYNL